MAFAIRLNSPLFFRFCETFRVPLSVILMKKQK